MRNYHDLLRKIMIEGIDSLDRTGVGTRSLFGESLRFNLDEGFPAVTTKKLAWKACVSELLWFIEGSGNERRLSEIQHGTRDPDKKTIWSANASAEYWIDKARYEGDLGVVYGNMWRKWPGNPDHITWINRKPKEPDNLIVYDPIIETPVITDDLTGQILDNIAGHRFIVLKNLGTRNRNSYYRIQFLRTGYIAEVSRPNVINKAHRDWFEPMQSGVGVYGREKKGKQSKLDKRIYSLWDNMISRCYSTTHPLYKFYGMRGVTVSTEWQNFANFEQTIKNVPGFHNWANRLGYELDKDHYGANQYSASTTIFVPKKYNLELSKGKFKENGNLLERRNYFVDQLRDLIDGLQRDPYSRRHILSAWNVGELDQMALPPCHMMSQYYIRNGKLSCQMYQRSCDAFLGLPFNIASYALLTHLIAKTIGAGVGELIVVLGDVHIYNNHFDAVTEQLSRSPRSLPRLDISNVSDIWSAKMADIGLIGYDPYPMIKAEMAV